ncbi:MAG: AraC family transcriptional regulator [Kofleriaceae bacterium]
MAIRFGMWSTILLLGSGHGLVMAWLLVRARANRLANRFLAALLVVVVLRVTPYTLGYAGFYDAFPWLSFAPLDWRLAMGPLLYLYVRQRFEPRLPARWGWHFAPALLEGGYYLIAFAMPLAWKDDWNDRVHVPWIVPLEIWAGHASLLGYWLASRARYQRWQRWLEQHSAAREEHRLDYLRRFLTALAAMTALQLGFDVAMALGVRLDYFDRFPLYLAFTGLVYYLGLEGWRHAEQRSPSLRASADEVAEVNEVNEVDEVDEATAPREGAAVEASPARDAAPAEMARGADAAEASGAGADGGLGVAASGRASPPEPRGAAARDWRELGQQWAARLAEAAWWREPELSLAEVARRLGTNTRYLSRAFNEGLGLSFSELINRQRVDEAKRRLAADADLGGARDGEILTMALDVGFASKASFNRAFKTYAGCTPSEYRAERRRSS